MNILKAREIVKNAMAEYNSRKGQHETDLVNMLSNILAEETTEAFLNGVKFGKGYKVEEERNDTKHTN